MYWLSPPPDLAIQLNISVVYCPFGMIDYACPGIPTVTLIVDVLHRDYPYTLPAEGVAFRENFFCETIKKSDYFQCISQFTIDRMMEFYGIENTRSFCTYIPIHDRLNLISESDKKSLNLFLLKQNSFFTILPMPGFIKIMKFCCWLIVFIGNGLAMLRGHWF